MTQMTTGARVRWLREQHGWTRGQLLILAQQALERLQLPGKFSRSTLYRYEMDERSPETWSVIALAAALQTTTDFLLLLTDDPAPSPVGRLPVAGPVVAPLVERLNALDPVRRATVAAALLALLDTLAPATVDQGQTCQHKRIRHETRE